MKGLEADYLRVSLSVGNNITKKLLGSFQIPVWPYIAVDILIIKVFNSWSQDNCCNSRQLIKYKAEIKEKECCQ